jgi:hypothetical protein
MTDLTFISRTGTDERYGNTNRSQETVTMSALIRPRFLVHLVCHEPTPIPFTLNALSLSEEHHIHLLTPMRVRG